MYSTLSSIEIFDVSSNSNPPASASPRRKAAQFIISAFANPGWLRSLQRRSVRVSSSQSTKIMQASLIPAIAIPSFMNSSRIWPSNRIGRARDSFAILTNHSMVVARCQPSPDPQPAIRCSGDGTPMLSKRNTQASGHCSDMFSAIVVLPEPEAPVRMTIPMFAIFHSDASRQSIIGLPGAATSVSGLSRTR